LGWAVRFEPLARAGICIQLKLLWGHVLIVGATTYSLTSLRRRCQLGLVALIGRLSSA
jgi:hypothetical protein